MSAPANYEDVIFYLDLTKDTLKKKDIIKTLKIYIEQKNKVNLKGRYGILIFQEEGNPIFITDKKDSKIILKAVEENWRSRPKEQSFFENGLFYIFSYIAETVRKKSKFNRVIVITDTPSDLSADYQEALFNLVSKIKHFPTFIDIIRVALEKGDRFFKDDVKLNILASDTKGGIFYVENKKDFADTINKLIKSKQLTSTFAERPDQIKISMEDYAFYSRLAKDLKQPDKIEDLICFFCHEQVCPICTNVNDIPFICEECGAPFHNCCVINFTITHNIGIPHILRCPKCDVLLKIDEDEIIAVSGEEDVTTVKEYIRSEVLEKIPMSLDEIPKSSNDAPKILIDEGTPQVKAPSSDQLQKIPQTRAPVSGEPVKKIRVGGFFGKVYSVKSVGGKLIYERTTKTSETGYEADITIERPKSSQPGTPTGTETQQKPRTRVNICPICGTQAKASGKNCTTCGSKL